MPDVTHPRPKRLRRTKSEIQKLLRDLSQSGLSPSQYAREHKISLSTLSGWQRRQAKAHPQGPGVMRAPKVAKGLVPVSISDAPQPLPVQKSELPFEVELRSGCRVRVPGQFDMGSLVRLLRTLEETSC